VIFGKKRTYKLPKFPPDVIPTFRSLCESLEHETLLELKPNIDSALGQIHELAEKNNAVNAPLAEAVADRCHLLIDIYNDYSAEEQALIVGAVRYFAIVDDGYSAASFATGLHDDAKVINYVLEEIGVVDRYIVLEY